MPERGPILRYYVPPETREEHLAECMATCKACGFKEVSLFTTLYNAWYLEETQFERQLMPHLQSCAEAIRAAGLIFTLNVFHTLGHVRVPQEIVERFGFERQITMDGKWAVHPVLDPRCSKLRRHLRRVYARYASLQPRLMFLDDDFHVKLETAFHSGRVEEAAQQLGCAPTREAVVSLVQSSDPEKSNRACQIMLDLATRDLEDFAKVIQEAVHAVAPRTRLGLMFPDSVVIDVGRVARALAGPHQPFVRPQVTLYREEKALYDYPAAFWSVTKWKARLGEDFEFYPECENCPYNDCSKSGPAVYAHLATIFARGESAPATSLNSNNYGEIPAGESRRIVHYVAQRKNQIQQIARLLDGTTQPAGIGVWSRQNINLELLGLPFDATRNVQDAVIHFGNALSGCSDEQVHQVVDRGGVFDVDSLRILEERNLLSSLGCEMGPACNLYDLGGIHFDRMDQLGQKVWDLYYFIRALPVSGCPVSIEISNAEIRNWIHGVSGKPLVPLSLKWTSPNGGRFAFINFSYRLWPIYSWLHPWFPPLLSDLISWVSGKPLPVQVEQRARVAVQICRLPDKNAALITVINYSTGPYEDVPLQLGPEFATSAFCEIKADGSERSLTAEVTADKVMLHIPGPVPCLDVRFVVAQKRKTR